ncbi:hypothetical protein ACN38_g3942, partial [Penicillium nordicum]
YLLISSLTRLRAEKMYVMFTGCLSTFCIGKSYKGYLVKNGICWGAPTTVPVAGRLARLLIESLATTTGI